MLKQNFANLLESEMDRKDFLKALGVAMVAFTGAAAALKTITSNPNLVSGSQSKFVGAYGYGASVYGGTQVDSSSRAVSSKHA